MLGCSKHTPLTYEYSAGFSSAVMVIMLNELLHRQTVLGSKQVRIQDQRCTVYCYLMLSESNRNKAYLSPKTQ